MLLVEDETPLRKLLHQVLRSAGHTVLEAANGDEAFAIGIRHSGQIDLLLTDVVMPGMKGHELVDKLRARRPEITVLYMSGYDNELVDKKHLGNGSSFLAKPFSPKMLLKRIHTLLGYGGTEGEKASFAD